VAWRLVGAGASDRGVAGIARPSPSRPDV